jgi:hypothetical protein
MSEESADLMKYVSVFYLVGSVACTSAPPDPAGSERPAPRTIESRSTPAKIEGMWSDPPATPEGAMCFFACTDEGVKRLNALMDDPKNDARPFPALQADAGKYEDQHYFKPRLTAAALKTYPLDPADDPGFLRCEPWGLARQMFAPHQLEIRTRGGSEIELRYGEWAARRTVYMDGRTRSANQAPSPLGYSVGHWEGETLVVETSSITKNITGWDAEHSDQLRVVERFTRSNEGDTLLLTATLEDPWSLKEPVVLKKIWRWAPDQQITPYENCERPTEFSRGKSPR